MKTLLFALFFACLQSHAGTRVQFNGRVSPIAGDVTVPNFQALTDIEMDVAFDMHIHSIGILQTNDQRPQLYFSDKDNGEGVLGYADFTDLLPIASSVGLQTITVSHCRDYCDITLPFMNLGYVYALAGFKLEKNDGDFHIHRFGIESLGDYKLRAYLSDNGGEDEFTATIQYYWVAPGLHLTTTRKKISKESKGLNDIEHNQTRLSTPGYYAYRFLRGFSFTFLNKDHHLRLLQSSIASGVASARLGDLNGLDPYVYTINYVELTRK